MESPAVPAEDLKRVEKFTLEPFLHEGEDAAAVLAPGTPRRRALDDALAELDAGLSEPSVTWRQHYSLMLGLERLVSQDEPKLVDGTVLDAHQVDALSGTLIALLAEAQSSNGNGSRNGGVAPDGGRGAAVGRGGARGRRGARRRGRAARLAGQRARGGRQCRGRGRRPERRAPLLVRARHRRRQVGRRARLRRGLAHRRRPDPHPPPQPRRAVRGRAARPRLPQAHRARAPEGREVQGERARSRSRPTSGSCATRATSRTPTRS